MPQPAALSPEPRAPGPRRLDRPQRRRRRASPGDNRPADSAWGATIGQMCAYFGIGLITCGTAVVIWGYYGGPPRFAPTGWLVTTIGQMFLFLGVVTLVSHGLDQTSGEVASHLLKLDQRLRRIETRRRRNQPAVEHPHRADHSEAPASITAKSA